MIFSIFLIAVCILSFIFLHLGFLFYQEHEPVAAQKAILISVFSLFIGTLIFHLQVDILIYFSFGLLLLFAILFIYPFKSDLNYTDDAPDTKYDERDIIFSRRALIPGSDTYEAYYEKYPEREALDNKFRKEPGLLSSKSMYYHEKAFQMARESFDKIEPLYNYIEGNVNPTKTFLSAEDYTNLIKSRATDLGALDIGITHTKPYHFYSHKGRWNEYGNEIKNTHGYAIACTVEMNHDMVKAAPQASIVAESAKQYLNSGIIATEIAELIRTLGFKARPHIDGNYQLICPLVARDAGLGEIGRMGLLMTPKHGPRVRIAVVTTDLELEVDRYRKAHSVIDFCKMCKKCADCCPSQSIPFDDPKLIDGIKRWKIDAESCYTFWCRAGTDCGRCMAVCPYSHPNYTLHKVMRWAIRRSKMARYMALKIDDYFYGKKPAPKPIPKELKS